MQVFWYRLYTCVSHTECKFRARFGPRRGDKQLVLKSSFLYHSGRDRKGTYNCGRKFKHPITHTITPVIDKVQSVKSANTVAQDIVKATKALEGKQSTYPQAHKVLLKKKAADNLDGKASYYQLLIPYIDEFVKLNPGTTSSYERNEKNNITKIFLCPGIMNNKLRHVRPVLSFNDAHVSSDIKGTLYLATIKSGNNEILPIAICMTEANECYKGWKYFLEIVRSKRFS